MPCTAIVTGGVTSIGAATCRALKRAGYQVAATYFGNRDDAGRFRDETGIPTYEWSVANFDACQRGVAEVTTAFAPIDILINNAGITQDATLHK